jgi:hypothetical protein
MASKGITIVGRYHLPNSAARLLARMYLHIDGALKILVTLPTAQLRTRCVDEAELYEVCWKARVSGVD